MPVGSELAVWNSATDPSAKFSSPPPPAQDCSDHVIFGTTVDSENFSGQRPGLLKEEA